MRRLIEATFFVTLIIIIQLELFIGMRLSTTDPNRKRWVFLVEFLIESIATIKSFEWFICFYKNPLYPQSVCWQICGFFGRSILFTSFASLAHESALVFVLVLMLTTIMIIFQEQVVWQILGHFFEIKWKKCVHCTFSHNLIILVLF